MLELLSLVWKKPDNDHESLGLVMKSLRVRLLIDYI